MNKMRGRLEKIKQQQQYKCGGGGGKTIEMWWWRRKPIEFYDLKTYIKAQHFAWLSQSTFCS